MKLHLKQTMNVPIVATNGKQFTVISTFAGCGGSSLGYHWAGFKELLAIDFDKNAVETFKLNFDVPIWQRDIKTVTAQEILDFCGIGKGELDVLDGSPPCQGFSLSGKRQVKDERNDLFKEFVRLIDGLQPKVFVMENVSGMIKGKMKGRFLEILQTLKSLNYNVKCKLMNAMWYNVPQSRERTIFVGVRNDLGIEPSFPKSNHKSISLREAFENLPKQDNIEYFSGKRLELAKKIRPWKDGSDVIQGQNFNLKRLSWNKPSRTILKSIGKNNSHFGGGLIHPEEHRNITILEAKRVSTFPDDFQFIGSFQDQWARIGNSVPPKMMQAIAENIRDNILNVYYLQKVI